MKFDRDFPREGSNYNDTEDAVMLGELEGQLGIVDPSIELYD